MPEPSSSGQRDMDENSRRAVMEKYNWQNEAEKLLAVYEELSGRAQ